MCEIIQLIVSALPEGRNQALLIFGREGRAGTIAFAVNLMRRKAEEGGMV